MCIARHSNNHAFLYVEFLVENITEFSQWNYLAIQKSPMRKGKFLTETFFKPVSFFLWVLLIFTFCNCIMRHVFLKTVENLRNLKIIHIHQLIGKCSTWVGFSSSIRLKWVIFITFLDISFFLAWSCSTFEKYSLPNVSWYQVELHDPRWTQLQWCLTDVTVFLRVYILLTDVWNKGKGCLSLIRILRVAECKEMK